MEPVLWGKWYNLVVSSTNKTEENISLNMVEKLDEKCRRKSNKCILVIYETRVT